MKKLKFLFLLLTIFSCQTKESEQLPKSIASTSEVSYEVLDQDLKNLDFMGYRIKKFNEKNQPIAEEIYASDSTLNYKFKYYYEKDRKVKEEWMLDEGEVYKYVKLYYNEKNQLERSEDYNLSNELQSTYIHTRPSEDESEVSTTRFINGEQFLGSSLRKYDANKEVVWQKDFNKDGSLKTFYSFKVTKSDASKQWTEKHFFQNDSLKRVIKRTITYAK